MRQIALQLTIIFALLGSLSAQCPVKTHLINPTSGQIFEPGDSVHVDFAVIESGQDYFDGGVIFSFSSNNGKDWTMHDTIHQNPPFYINPIDTSVIQTFDDYLEWIQTATLVSNRYNFIAPNINSDSCLILLKTTNGGCYGGTVEVFSITKSTGIFQERKMNTAEVEIYPNPLPKGNNLRIKNANSIQIDEVQIVDSTRAIMKIIKKPDDSIALNGLTSGIYFIRFISDQEVITTKKLRII